MQQSGINYEMIFDIIFKYHFYCDKIPNYDDDNDDYDDN